MAGQLKVFSTAAGFVNAVVAAPSQKAALEAWGVRDNLFASGAATVVTDPDLMAKALAKPGEIVRVPISTDAGFLAAAKPPSASAAKAHGTVGASHKAKASSPKARAQPPPPPDRSALTTAEKTMEEAQARQRAALAELDAYQRRRAQVEKTLSETVAKAERTRAAAQTAFRAAGGRP